MPERPIIGILLDHEQSGTFSARPHYALRTGYFDAVWQAGGFPIGIPYLTAAMNEYLNHIDALITPGGRFQFPESWYDGETRSQTPIISSEEMPRLAFETALIHHVLDQDMPLLGICCGMQILAGYKGATFYRDVGKETETTIDHLNERPADQTAHDIKITPDSLLHRITGKEEMAVNTAHGEAIRTLPDGINITAVAPDGVIEAIELPEYRFALGVQWHPEFFLTKGDANRAIIEAFIEAAKQS